VVQTAVVEAGSSNGLASSYLRLVRPRQWTKNGFVLAGVVFAEKAFSATAVAHALLAFVIFCALSGAVYAANDVLDVEEDRKHPLKRFRPVASGEISARAALIFSAALAAGALVLSFTLLPYGVGIAGIAYLVLQVFYTIILKHAAIPTS
jgi:4-hydroxybenzoate polyprenyltransferase